MKKEGLYEKLIEYSRDGRYPFHMPGHKRSGQLFECNNPDESQKNLDPFDIDLTEIEGTDNLHNAQGIIKESMDFVADYLGTKKTFFLVNGSSCGLLAAIHSVCNIGDSIIVGRNCHKAVYHGIETRDLKADYVIPDWIEEFGIYGGVSVQAISNAIKKNPKAKAVLITSPTYEGVISDIAQIAELVHKNNMILIVDEAHGAHLKWGEKIGKPAYLCGADIVVESVHKTLSGMTQTGVLHVCSDRVDDKKIAKALSVYESSSPSYVLMASIDKCYRELVNNGREKMDKLLTNLAIFRDKVNNLNYFKVVDDDIIGRDSVYQYDVTKLPIMCDEKYINGTKLASILRTMYNIEVEMVCTNYVLAYTSMWDTAEAFEKLAKALEEIDQKLANGLEKIDHELEEIDVQLKDNYESKSELANDGKQRARGLSQIPDSAMTIYEASIKDKELVNLDESLGRVMADYIYVYPPGAPVIAPGEIMDENTLNIIKRFVESGLEVIGIDGDLVSVTKLNDK